MWMSLIDWNSLLYFIDFDEADDENDRRPDDGGR